MKQIYTIDYMTHYILVSFVLGVFKFELRVYRM